MPGSVERVLQLWREGERLLVELPAKDPERNVIQFEVVQLRGLYRRMTEASDATGTRLTSAVDTLERANALFRQARDRLGQPD